MNVMNPAMFTQATKGLAPTASFTTPAPQAPSYVPNTQFSACAQGLAEQREAATLAQRMFNGEEIPGSSVMWAVAACLSEVTWGWMEKAFPGCTKNPRKAEASLKLALSEFSPDSFCHCARVAELALRFAHELGLDEEEEDILERGSWLKEAGLIGMQLAAMEEHDQQELADMLRNAGNLHDIGKLCLPEEVLDKAGPLTEEEYQLVQLHPIIGEAMLEHVGGMDAVLPAVRHHHERWDGQGYPDGVWGEAIPTVARIIALADSYDAMTGPRPYRTSLTPSQAVAEILAKSGTQFDPELAPRFCEMILAHEEN